MLRSFARYHLPLLLVLGAFFTGFAIDTTPVADWDEARRGVNAIRMLQTGDWWTYRYADQIDNFNTKPPLYLWLLAATFEVMGATVTTLRLPNAVLFLTFLALTYRFAATVYSPRVAWLAGLILIVTEGICGFHVARSGDIDMLFVLFTSLAVYLLALFRLRGKARYAYCFLLVLWLAFLTKGLAVALLIPGLATWMLLELRHLRLPRPLLIRLSLAGVVLALAAAVVLLQMNTESDRYQSLLHAQFLNDGLRRFTDASFESGYHWDYLPVMLDVKFSPFNYLLYVFGLFWVIRRYGLKRNLQLDLDPVARLLVAVVLSVMLVLVCSQNKHEWYLAPAFPFLAILTAKLLTDFLTARHRFWPGLLFGLFLILFVKKAWSIEQRAAVPQETVRLSGHNRVLYAPVGIDQSCLFDAYLKAGWRGVEVRLVGHDVLTNTSYIQCAENYN